MFKKTIFAITVMSIFITSCGGGGSSGGQVTLSPSSIENLHVTMGNSGDVESPDFITHTLGKNTVTIQNNNPQPVKIISIYSTSESDVVESGVSSQISTSSCNNTILSSGQTCQFVEDFGGVYTTPGVTNLVIKTQLGNKNIALKIQNYNWTHNQPIDKILTYTLDGKKVDQYGNLQESGLGQNTIYVTNLESSPVWINRIHFTSSEVVGDDGKGYHLDNLNESQSSCGGTLLPNQSCVLAVDFEAIDSYYNNPDEINVDFQGGSVSQHAWIQNNTKFADNMFSVNCTTLGTCKIKSKKFPSGKVVKLINASVTRDWSDNPLTGVTVLPSQTPTGCVAGLDINKLGGCDMYIERQSYPIVGSALVNVDFKYYFNESVGVEFKQMADGKIHLDSGGVEQLTFEQSGSFGHGNFDTTGKWQPHGGFVNLVNDENNPYPITITGVTVTKVENTDLMNVYTGELFSEESVIYSDECTNTKLYPIHAPTQEQPRECKLGITTAENACGSAGTLMVNYKIGESDPTIYHTVVHLNDAMQPTELTVDAQNTTDDTHPVIWRYGEKNKTVHISTAKTGPFPPSIGIINTTSAFVGSYLNISKNFYQYHMTSIPECVNYKNGWMASGVGNQYCGYSLLLDNAKVGESIPLTLTLGAHGETTLTVIYDIISEQNANHTIYFGAIK